MGLYMAIDDALSIAFQVNDKDEPLPVYGYHGTSEKRAAHILTPSSQNLFNFNPSANDYDWLGHGIYFFQDYSIHVVEHAEAAARQDACAPAVLQFEIDLTDCLDLGDYRKQNLVLNAFKLCDDMARASGVPLPRQQSLVRELAEGIPGRKQDLPGQGGPHRLDCYILNHARLIAQKKDKHIKSARGIFVEGKPIYENSHFHSRAHVQIAVFDQSVIRRFVRRIPIGESK